MIEKKTLRFFDLSDESFSLFRRFRSQQDSLSKKSIYFFLDMEPGCYILVKLGDSPYSVLMSVTRDCILLN